MIRITCRQHRNRVLVGVLVVIGIITVRYFMPGNSNIDIPGYEELNQEDYPELGIFSPEQFPSVGPPRIEKIIHQTWKDENIPNKYIEWMKTWSKHNPGWTYMFWTDASARKLIEDKHPYLLAAYDGYLENIRRADALRYVILYEYGGVYADLDIENLRPLEDIVRKYSCILAQEPYEHPIIDGNFEHLVINAFMACAAGHPMMKKFMESLPAFAHLWNVLDSTGPHYITLLYRQYVAETKLKPTDKAGVYLAPAEYFFPTIDPVKFKYMKEKCLKFKTLLPLQKEGCVALKRRGLARKPYNFSFTDHHWAHTYFVSQFSIVGPAHIRDIVPTAKFYKSENLKPVPSDIYHVS